MRSLIARRYQASLTWAYRFLYVRYLLFLHLAMLVLKYKTVGDSYYLDARKGSAFYSDQNSSPRQFDEYMILKEGTFHRLERTC
jgi:hypothetical protein